MLAHRLRRWSNIVPTLGERLGLAGTVFAYTDSQTGPQTGTQRGDFVCMSSSITLHNMDN